MVKNLSKFSSWGARPIRRRVFRYSFTTSWPKTAAVPPPGETSPVRMPMSVLFPAPFGPRRPKNSPVGTVRSIPSSAQTLP
jgi:hypothetical protein